MKKQKQNYFQEILNCAIFFNFFRYSRVHPVHIPPTDLPIVPTFLSIVAPGHLSRILYPLHILVQRPHAYPSFDLFDFIMVLLQNHDMLKFNRQMHFEAHLLTVTVNK